MTQARIFTTQRDYHPYILQVLRDAGGSAHISDIHAKTRERMRDVLLPGDEALAVKGKDGPKERFGMYVSRALTALKNEKKIKNTKRGMWEVMNE